MATTQTRVPSADVWGEGFHKTAIDLSTIMPEEPVDVSHGGLPSGITVHSIDWEVRTRTTLGAPIIQVTHEAASDSTTNDTARVRVSTLPGYDLTGAVVRVWFNFHESATGGIS